MARTVRNYAMNTRAARERLKVQTEPYWTMINEGQHLGYYRGKRFSKWVARYRRPGAKGGYTKITLGEADDITDANGSTVLDWRQAQDKARAWFDTLDKSDGRVAGPYTVSDALDDYLEAFQGKDVVNVRSRIDGLIRLALGKIDLAKLTQQQIEGWHRAMAKSPAKLRTSKGAKVDNVRPLTDDESIRRRRSTANRILTVLKAALNHAFRNRKVSSDLAWRLVKPFKKVDEAKLRYLSDDEAVRIANACDPVFRPMVQAALLTGGRYGELSKARVRDFDAEAGVLMLTETKSSKPRPVYLDEEGVDLLTVQAVGKSGDAWLFPRPDGKCWGASQQARYMGRACANGRIEPAAGFHDLRRTFGARLAKKGVPMAYIAEALGHADERITRKHYAHLAPSHVASVVREAISGLGIVAKGNVESIGHRRQA